MSSKCLPDSGKRICTTTGWKDLLFTDDILGLILKHLRIIDVPKLILTQKYSTDNGYTAMPVILAYIHDSLPSIDAYEQYETMRYLMVVPEVLIDEWKTALASEVISHENTVHGITQQIAFAFRECKGPDMKPEWWESDAPYKEFESPIGTTPDFEKMITEGFFASSLARKRLSKMIGLMINWIKSKDKKQLDIKEAKHKAEAWSKGFPLESKDRTINREKQLMRDEFIRNVTPLMLLKMLTETSFCIRRLHIQKPSGETLFPSQQSPYGQHTRTGDKKTRLHISIRESDYQYLEKWMTKAYFLAHDKWEEMTVTSHCPCHCQSAPAGGFYQYTD
jgi:hypothetical protein